jgi:hypothetical protein
MIQIDQERGRDGCVRRVGQVRRLRGLYVDTEVFCCLLDFGEKQKVVYYRQNHR